MDINIELATTLREIINAIAPKLHAIKDAEASKQPAPNKWSKKLIVGHLVDSALNNVGRFVRAQKTFDLIYEGYDQEFWVEAQDYENVDWEELVTLFVALNLQIARTVNRIDREVLLRVRTNHSMKPPFYVENDGVVTLKLLIEDYIAHLENHLKQIMTDYKPRVLGR
jgi:hypothetical protein